MLFFKSIRKYNSMADYKSNFTGTQVDSAVDKVLNNNCIVKYGNLIGSLEDQTDLKEALDKLKGISLLATKEGSIYYIYKDKVQQTFSDIQTIVNNNQYVYLTYNGYVYLVSSISLGSTSQITFYNCQDFISTQISIDSNNKVSLYEWVSENRLNKTTSLNSNSTDTQYPSAKAVFDFVKEKQQAVSGGDSIEVTENNVINAETALLGYELNQEILDDKFRKELYERKHSSVNPIKCKKEGSVNISEDGIASNFSGTNYMETAVIDTTKPWGLTFRVRYEDVSVLETSNVVLWASNFRKVQIRSTGASIVLNSEDSNNATLTVSLNLIPNNVFIENNKNYTFRVTWDGSVYSSYCMVDDGDWIAVDLYESSTPMFKGTTPWTIGGFKIDGESTFPFLGEMDLKYFEITNFDSIFNYNYTGIDNVISNGEIGTYEVIGTPTITDTGIYSSDSEDSYIKTYYAGSFDLSFNMYISSVGTIATNYILGGSSKEKGFLEVTWDGVSSFSFKVKDNDEVKGQVTLTVDNGKVGLYKIKVSLSSDYKNLTAEITDPEEVTKSSTVLVAEDFTMSETSICLGYSDNFTIDLNTMKNYSEGVLIFQPCLIIPYSLSKSGAKIVNTIYLNRLKDMYSLKGMTPYYTISELKNNAYLPMGDLFGVISTLNNNSVHKNGNETINGTKTFTSIIQGTANSAIKDYSGNEITTTYQKVITPGENIKIENNSVSAPELIKYKNVTNCILEAPSGVFVQNSDGNWIIPKGLRFLSADGKDINGNIKNVDVTLTETIVLPGLPSNTQGPIKFYLRSVDKVNYVIGYRYYPTQWYEQEDAPSVDYATWFNTSEYVWTDITENVYTTCWIVPLAVAQVTNGVITRLTEVEAPLSLVTKNSQKAYFSDYSRSVSIPYNTIFTAPEDGNVFVYTNLSAASSPVNPRVQIDVTGLINPVASSGGTTTKTHTQEYTQAGTYTFNAPQDGWYKFILVGGGGTGITHVNQYFVTAHGSGGSGAAFIGQLYLTAGNHTITVGGYSGATSVDGLIVAGAGGNASMTNTVSATAGSAGIISVTGQVQNVSLQSNGNSGSAVIGSPCAGGASLYNGWGAGASSEGLPATGYAYIEYTTTETTGSTYTGVLVYTNQVRMEWDGQSNTVGVRNNESNTFSIQRGQTCVFYNVATPISGYAGIIEFYAVFYPYKK